MKAWGRRLAPKDSSIGRILENTAWLLGSKGVGAVLSLIYLAIITRTLGPEGFGHFTLITTTAQVVGLLISFESWQVIVKYGQAHVASASGDRFGRLVRFCLVIDICAAIVGCFIAAAIIAAMSWQFAWSSSDMWKAIAYCTAMLLTIRSTPTGILRLFDRFDAGALADTMIPIGRMIGATAAWLIAPTITTFLIAWVAAEILCAVTYWVFALNAANKRMGSLGGQDFLAARFENPGIIGFLTATSLSISVAGITKQLSVLIVGFFVGASEAGFYRLGYQLSAALTKISALLGRTIFAELARVSAIENAGQDLQALFRRTNRLSIVVGAVIIALVVLAGKPLLVAMAGPEFAGAYPILLLLGVAASIDLIGVSFEPMMMATGHARTSVTIKLICGALLIGLLFVLLPMKGAIGAAYATLIVAVVGFVAMGIAARRYSGSTPAPQSNS